MKFCDKVEDTSYFRTPLPDCLRHVLFSRYSPLSLEVVENRANVKKFLTPIVSGGMTPTFLRQIVSATYRLRLTKCGWVSVALISVSEAWQWSGMQNFRTVGKNYGPIWSRLWTKVHEVFRRCSRPLELEVCNALARLYISHFVP